MILNKGMFEEATAAGLAPERLLWMPNPVDTEEFSPCDPTQREALRAELGIGPQALVALFVGRLAPEKEIPSLLLAFARVVAKLPHACLVLVGDGPVRGALERQAGELGLTGHACFTGRQFPAEVLRWLRVSDIFTLVSSNEGFSCSLAEAMSVGLPSVVSHIPANTQLVDAGIHGLHAKVRDEVGIADALINLLGDPSMRISMGEAATTTSRGELLSR